MNLQEAVEKFDEIESVEDSILHVECFNCGTVIDTIDMGEYEISEECECGEEFTPSTCHEGQECTICSHIFDMWEDGYSIDDELICNNCYDDIERSVESQQE